MSAKIQVIFDSIYGHICKLAEAVAEGARQVPGSDVKVLQVVEIPGADILSKMGANEAKKAFAQLPIANPQQLADAVAIILGIPIRFGSTDASMQALFDATGGHWMNGSLIGKVGSACPLQ